LEPAQEVGVLRQLRMGALDLLGAVALAVVLANTPVGYFFATRAVVMLRIGSPDTLWKGPIPMLMGIAGTFVYSLPIALFAVAMFKPLLVEPAARDAAWRRAIVRSAPWWGLTIALLAGSWVLAVISCVVAIAFLGRRALPEL
jgi:hypothetical protein